MVLTSSLTTRITHQIPRTLFSISSILSQHQSTHLLLHLNMAPKGFKARMKDFIFLKRKQGTYKQLIRSSNAHHLRLNRRIYFDNPASSASPTRHGLPNSSRPPLIPCLMFLSHPIRQNLAPAHPQSMLQPLINQRHRMLMNCFSPLPILRHLQGRIRSHARSS